jgi:hypothetical protein
MVLHTADVRYWKPLEVLKIRVGVLCTAGRKTNGGSGD